LFPEKIVREHFKDNLVKNEDAYIDCSFDNIAHFKIKSDNKNKLKEQFANKIKDFEQQAYYNFEHLFEKIKGIIDNFDKQ
jgi:hypothetical protein